MKHLFIRFRMGAFFHAWERTRSFFRSRSASFPVYIHPICYHDHAVVWFSVFLLWVIFHHCCCKLGAILSPCVANLLHIQCHELSACYIPVGSISPVCSFFELSDGLSALVVSWTLKCITRQIRMRHSPVELIIWCNSLLSSCIRYRKHKTNGKNGTWHSCTVLLCDQQGCRCTECWK